MGNIRSATFTLVRNNAIWIDLSYSEQVSGSTNRVSFTMTASTRYRINGSWPCRLIIDGQDFGAPRTTIAHGSSSSGGSTIVRRVEKVFEYSGSKTINVFAAIENMDYYDVSSGPSSMGYFYPNLSANINLATNNRAPNTPSISCTNQYANGKHLAESTLDVRLDGGADPDGDPVYYNIYAKCMRPNQGWEDLGCISNGQTANYNITGFPRGTQFQVWGNCHDNHGAYSGNSGTISNIWRNKTPNKVKEIKPKEGFFNGDNFTIEWDNPGDPDGTTPKFDLYLSKNQGEYANIYSFDSRQSYTHNIKNDPEGTTYKFKICTSDGQTTSSYTESSVYYKNTRPTIPKYIFPSGGYYLGKIKLSWNASTDPEKRGIDHYNVYINNKKVGESKTTSFEWMIPDSDPFEKEYTVSVEAVDYDNKVGDRGYAEKPFLKAKPPAPPSNLKPTTQYHESNITLTWDSIVSNGINAFYEVYYRVNNGTWIELTTSLKVSKYIHDITSINRGSKIEYRIRCRNSFGQLSDFTYSIAFYRNRIPLVPEIVYPKENSIIHDFSPRIAFNIKAEPDNQEQTIYVECGGKTYNSVTHKDMFSRNETSFATSNNLVFTCPTLPAGTTSITMYVNDTQVNSSKVTRTFEIENSNTAAKKDTIITAHNLLRMRECINNIRLAYGLQPIIFSDKINSSTFVKFKILEELRKAALNVRETINDYDLNNINKIDTTWINSGKDEIIYGSLFEQVIEIIENP